MNVPTTSCQAAFNFTEFAREIYSNSPDIYVEPLRIEDRFLLPALYGGEAAHGEVSGPFKALIVLEEPSRSFTKDRWTQCTTPEEAIVRHREIFFEWAFEKPERAELFRIFVDNPSTARDFFRRVYITDIWKDAAFRENRKRGNPGYGRYWRSKLAIEIRSVATEWVIFVGRQARSGCQHVPPGTPKRCLVFPSWHNPTFEAEVQRLRAEVHGQE